ncbi:uncharacterized protein LOC655336 isoform X1 [Tribolium castaneum]|uniref:Uncharacterized protein n=1 Tax=Tribolium castaneum TaxID=7070 RepID=D6W985_TRICA|nr:PREDICTED: uncharacterized protein LOC655336 isoform X1 [Tribolium castaneum]EEZ98200.1 hypothetical protein TcasGA2_TC000630 [Tribolium castaneum]|eukprot:XP_976032.1 PREDICTED: uncharacterized protein LOC655336 isoform X1 [Tribolium castaneum]
MATQEDRSLSSGMSLPQWMKTKMNDRLDFEQSAFSPTELDDSFMYYYRSKTRGFNDTQNQTLAANLKDKNWTGAQPDFSKHTPYCQKFLQNSIDSTTAQQVRFPSATKTKSSGVDDGFKGEAAKCGTSVVRVAHQMVLGKAIRGFDIQKKDCDLPPEGFNPSLRRGSKSLPASPLTSPNSSPKSTRRVNKYFTGPFVDSEHQGSWILSNLLAKRQNLSQSMGFIAEEEKEMKRTESNLSVDEVSNGKRSQVFVPKPSELREMNFWSPTSM